MLRRTSPLGSDEASAVAGDRLIRDSGGADEKQLIYELLDGVKEFGGKRTGRDDEAGPPRTMTGPWCGEPTSSFAGHGHSLS